MKNWMRTRILWVCKIGFTAQIYAKDNILIILVNVDKNSPRLVGTLFDLNNVLLASKRRIDM